MGVGHYPMKMTSRMRQVLGGIAQGHTNLVIAGRLNLSPKTVEKHRTKLYALFRVDNAVSLVVSAIRTGEVRV